MDKSLWVIAPQRVEAENLASQLSIPLPIAQILVNRQILDPQTAQAFLFGNLRDLLDPYLLAGMDKAVRRVRQAIARKEKILIFGDYDVDGVLSVVMLLKAVRSLGGEVDYFIPQRLKEGYGIKDEHIRLVLERGARLVISVDCGIKAVEFAAKARQNGVDIIITDHHQPGEILPDVLALVNPVLKDSSYPERNLAGVGVVFKLIQALLEGEGKESALPHYAKLVAIGTIADVSDLRGENRLLVKQGLEGLAKISNRGLKFLIDNCGLHGKRITEGDVGFRIAPRINAAGRMGKADTAVQLFFSEAEEDCARIAHSLEVLNSRRQREEGRIYREALERIKKDALNDRYKVLIMGCETWHRGVIGIVASKLKDYFYRPVLLFSYEDGKAHGSGRSISELPLIDCLDDCREVFLDYGGHTHAVGCVLLRDRMARLRKKMNKVVDKRLTEENLRRKVRVDARINLSEIDSSFIDNFLRLPPFGVGNPKPVLLTEDLQVLSHPRLLQNKHIKFLAGQDGEKWEALGWEKGHWLGHIQKGDRLRAVYSLQFSSYLGNETVGLSLEDVSK